MENDSKSTQEGARFEVGGGMNVTVNSTDDARVPGGYYVSIGNGQDHSTSVHNSNGTLADVKANDDWVDSPRQD
jgi:hypothetical protein